MKKIIILNHDGGELANQLWNYSSIYAYARELGIPVINNSFFEYGSYFAIPHTFPADFLLFKPFRNFKGRKSDFKPRLWRSVYMSYVKYIRYIRPSQIIISSSRGNKPYYLPPTKPADGPLALLEKKSLSVYFDGWLFRNPIGLKKYHEDIKKFFKPQKHIEDTISNTLTPLRSRYTHIVGVHIRQGDYKNWKGGAYFIDQKRIRNILDEYLEQYSLSASTTCFLLASDGKIDTDIFNGLTTVRPGKNLIEDLFFLAATDTIIGSDSTFGDFAAYYGNIPHIILKNESIDWDYYKDKKVFFENKYCTVVHY